MITMKKEEAHIAYHNDLQESFYRFIDKPQFIETEDGFCGKMTDSGFWFYKRYPFIKNGFRTVLYGRIISDNQIGYRYGKWKGVRVFVCLVDLVSLIFFVYGIVNRITTGYQVFPTSVYVVQLLLCALITALVWYCPKGEKEILFRQLQKICGKSQ